MPNFEERSNSEKMTTDSLNQIRLAEQKADDIRTAAKNEAQKRLENAKKQADRLISDTEVETHAAAQRTVDDMKARADELIAATIAKAHTEADTIVAEAKKNTDEAVKMIYWEIVEKCLRA